MRKGGREGEWRRKGGRDKVREGREVKEEGEKEE